MVKNHEGQNFLKSMYWQKFLNETVQYQPLYNTSPSATYTCPKNCNHFFWPTTIRPLGHLLHKNWWYLLFLSACKTLSLMLQQYVFHHNQWYHKQYMSHSRHATVTLKSLFQSEFTDQKFYCQTTYDVVYSGSSGKCLYLCMVILYDKHIAFSGMMFILIGCS